MFDSVFDCVNQQTVLRCDVDCFLYSRELTLDEVTFSQKAGKGFYRQVGEATAKGEITAFTTFSAMPSGSLPPLNSHFLQVATLSL
ncbi:MAG: hypothetical protein LH702_23455 [Phormidesmis sp. CAN_BIN44]|nr:hypothetical protein [Phormidesmis sp. CAN_BIN44]